MGWTTPSVCTPKQADRWTCLIVAGYAKLRLARGLAGDLRLPWECPRPAARNPGAGPQGVSSTSLGDRHSSQSTEIDRGGSGTSKGDQSGPSHSLPRGQEGGLRARRRFKCKLGILMQCGRVSIRPTRRAGQGCLAALGRAGGEPDPRGCRWPRARCRYGRVLHA